jgi:hypothetical protein
MLNFFSPTQAMLITAACTGYVQLPLSPSLSITAKALSAVCKIVLLDVVHRLNYKIIKLQRFRSWILLPSSGKKKGGKRTESLSVYPNTEAEFSFQNIVVLLFYNLDDGQSPKEQFYIL